MTSPRRILSLFLLAAFSLSLLPIQAQEASRFRKPGEVVVVRRPQAVVGFNVDGGAVRDMFNKGVTKLTGTSSPAKAMKKLGITSKDIVGIKITTEGGRVFSSKRALVGAIVAALREAGIPAKQIIIWDKYRKHMQRAQWPATSAGSSTPAVTSVIPSTWWDPQVFYINEVVGKLIYGDFQFVGKTSSTGDDILLMARQAVQDAALNTDPDAVKVDVPEDQISNKSFAAKLVTQMCTKIINVPVLSDDKKTGLHGAMSTLALGSVDNTRRFTGRGNWGETAIAEIIEKNYIQGKTVLHVLDALIMQYAGGPKFDPSFTESPGALLIGTDPVAIDTVALEWIEHARSQNNIDPLGADTRKHINTAAEYGLGVGNREKIKIVKVP